MAGGILGLIGAAAGLAGDKPEVPKVPTIDAQAAQKKAASGNLATLGEAEKLASGVNVFNQGELLKMLEKAMPGWGGISAQAGKQIMSMLKGEVPGSDLTQLLNKEAAYGISSGTKGSEFLAARTARDYGLTQERQIEAGLSAAESWAQTAGRIGTPQPYNAANMFVTPSQQLQVEEMNAMNQWNTEWLKNQIGAMQSPLEAAGMGVLGSIDAMGGAALGGYLGNLTGQAIYGPGNYSFSGGGISGVNSFGRGGNLWSLGNDAEYQNYRSGLRETGGPTDVG